MQADSADEIFEFLRSLEKDEYQIREQIRDLSWYSKGAISYAEGFVMSYIERVEWFKYLQKKHDEESNKTTLRQENITPGNWDF